MLPSGPWEDHARHPDSALQWVQTALQEHAGHLRCRGGERGSGVDSPSGFLNVFVFLIHSCKSLTGFCVVRMPSSLRLYRRDGIITNGCSCVIELSRTELHLQTWGRMFHSFHTVIWILCSHRCKKFPCLCKPLFFFQALILTHPEFRLSASVIFSAFITVADRVISSLSLLKY